MAGVEHSGEGACVYGVFAEAENRIVDAGFIYLLITLIEDRIRTGSVNSLCCKNLQT